MNNNARYYVSKLTGEVVETHKEAMELFTSLYSIKKYDLAPNVAQWFPIEFRFPSADRV